MNRQLRREQKRLDKKQEKEKSRRRTSRRSALAAVRERRDAAAKRAAKSRDGGDGKAASGPKGKPARFAGLFAIVAAIGLALLGVQAGVEREGANVVFDVALFPLYFLMFGYFMSQWMMRRGSDRPLVTSLVTGVALALGIAVSQVVAPPPELAGDAAQTTAWKVWLGLGLGLPALAGGAYLGRLVYSRSA